MPVYLNSKETAKIAWKGVYAKGTKKRELYQVLNKLDAFIFLINFNYAMLLYFTISNYILQF